MGNSSHSFSNYNYDGFNRTTKVENFDGNIQINRYDAEGLRYEMMENNNLVQFIFNQNREVIAEQETEWTSYIRGSTLLASSAEHARTYYHFASDEMSSVTHIVDDKKILNEYEYDAWGEVVKSTETVNNRFKFNGQQLDPITQQYYLRARFYNPVIARFTQEDTYRGDGLNLYAYCRNNPVYYVDPTGHNPNCVKDAYEQIKAANPDMSTADAYRQAYREHAERKLNDPNLSPQERAKIEARQTRLNNQPNSPTPLSPSMTYAQARQAGLTASQAQALITGKNPLKPIDGTGIYGRKEIQGHHPMAKKAFEGAIGYNHKMVVSISKDTLAKLKVKHSNITGQQNSLYSAFSTTGKAHTLKSMREIEIIAMVNAGVPKNYATRVVDYAIVELYSLGITEPIIKPWNRG